MHPIVVKCIRVLTEDSVNGPLTTVTVVVTVVPDGPFNTATGSLTFFVDDSEPPYVVGARYRFNVEPM
jgi:hypothetical protein